MIELLGHVDEATWPSAWRPTLYRIHHKPTGRILGISRDPARCAAERLAEEGVGLAGETFHSSSILTAVPRVGRHGVVAGVALAPGGPCRDAERVSGILAAEVA